MTTNADACRAYRERKGTPIRTTFPLLPEPEEWRKQAACLDSDPDLWFPEKVRALNRHAIDVCHRCPVIALCARQALLGEEQTGVWAGVFLDRLNGPSRRRALAAITPPTPGAAA